MTTGKSRGEIVMRAGLVLQLILPARLTMVRKLQMKKLSLAVFTRGWTVSPDFPETTGTTH